MCGRFAATASQELVADTFEIDEMLGPPPLASYNIAPTDPVAVVLERHHERVLTTARWGLVPSWSKDSRAAARMINARVETLSERPAYRSAFAARRCLIPAQGYYEWTTVAPAAGATKPAKQPWFIRPADHSLMAMAGLYEFWHAPDDSWLLSFTVVTTSATDELGRIHDRMPVTVDPQNWAAWLTPDFVGDPRDLLDLEAGGFTSYPVSRLVNRVGNDGPELIEPLV